MTRLDAIKQIVAKTQYADEPRVLRHIRRILNDGDPDLEVKSLENYEKKTQKEYDEYQPDGL